jgi:hypothetical protein
LWFTKPGISWMLPLNFLNDIIEFLYAITEFLECYHRISWMLSLNFLNANFREFGWLSELGNWIT